MSRLLSAALAVLLIAPQLAAQDADFFGAGLAFSGNQLMVVKRAPARGPAAVHIFDRAADGWKKSGELRAPGAIERGFALSPGIAVSGEMVLVGSGEPNNQWGTHGWIRSEGEWVAAIDAAIGEPPEENRDLDMGTIMRILQPQARQVAAGGDKLLIGFQNGAHLFTSSSDGWVSVPIPGDAEPGNASSVAVSSTIGFLGNPLAGGSVTIIGPGEDGAWTRRGILDVSSLPDRSRFGASLSFDGNTLAVGAPAGGLVFLFTEVDGSWQEQDRVAMESANNFGSVIAINDDELLVTGGDAVHRYRRVGNEWSLAGRVDAPTNAANGAFGSALAIGEDAIAIGAPFAVGGRGRAWVYVRNGSDFDSPVELGPDAGPETMTGAEVKCDGGEAAGFECTDVDLESFLGIASLGGEPGDRASDIWGWTDPVTGREYGLIGLNGAMVFVDISDATNPRVVGELPANRSGARDIKVFQDHAFMTGDGAGDHGMVVFDLTRLRGVAGTGTVFDADAVYHGIASAHNLVIDTVGALAVAVAASSGGETCGGGLHFIDISNPKEPTFAGCYTHTEGMVSAGRTHDAMCVTYDGPDTDYTGKGICFASNETRLRIVDVTDRENPKPISAAQFPGQAYIHQGWLTEDKRYFYLNDELDELVGNTDRTRTVIFDVEDLDDPVMVGSFYGSDASSDHNMYVKGDRLYQANYQSGLRIWDISDPVNPREVGHFDTTPYQGNASGFYGAWTAFPFFESGTVIVSSMQEGLFMLKPKPTQLVP